MSILLQKDTLPVALVLEENHIQLNFIKELLARIHIPIVEIQNQKMAVETLKTKPVLFMLIDSQIPWFQVDPFIYLLKSIDKSRRLPVVASITEFRDADTNDLIKKHADAILYKPYNENEFFAQIGTILKRKILTKEQINQKKHEVEFSKSAKKKVLIVHDDPNIVHTLNPYLHEQYIIKSAHSEKDALALYGILKPDLIFSSMYLKGEMTFEMLDSFKIKDPKIAEKTVFLIQNDDNQSKALINIRGKNKILTYPFQEAETISLISIL